MRLLKRKHPANYLYVNLFMAFYIKYKTPKLFKAEAFFTIIIISLASAIPWMLVLSISLDLLVCFIIMLTVSTCMVVIETDEDVPKNIKRAALIIRLAFFVVFSIIAIASVPVECSGLYNSDMF